jgi:hypothetical protein
MPSVAAARFSAASTNAEPLSTYIASGTPRAASAGRSAAASRTRSSKYPQRAAITAREWSSRKANRYALRPATDGPCRASPGHSSFGRDASNRPNTAGGFPSGRVVSSSRPKCRCSVRTDGDQPHDVRKIRITCAAVRAGFSRFSPAASSRISASVRGVTCRAGGASAANPPVRQARIHRSIVPRDTVTGSPNGPGCGRAASSRTSRPRCRVDKAGSAASRIS